MNVIARYTITALVVLAPACFAQTWEAGGVAGGGFTNNLDIASAIGSATTGLANGLAFGAVLGHNLYPRISGELRYTYRFSDLRLSDGGQSATFKGLTHSVHYDVLVHSRRRDTRMQPFAAVGGGMRLFRGRGRRIVIPAPQRFCATNANPAVAAHGHVRRRHQICHCPPYYFAHRGEGLLQPLPNESDRAGARRQYLRLAARSRADGRPYICLLVAKRAYPPW